LIIFTSKVVISNEAWCGWSPQKVRSSNFSAYRRGIKRKEKFEFGFCGGLFVLLFAQTKSKELVVSNSRF
jgi:hypothetical protein